MNYLEKKGENMNNKEKYVNDSWKQEIEKIDNIVNNHGSVSEYFQSLGNISDEAFSNKEDGLVVVCIDEGCSCNAHDGDEAELNLAGSGILNSVEGASILLERNVGFIKTITSHDECGAAKLAGKDAKTYTEELVSYINKKHNVDIVSKHISSENMTREHMHNAVAVYFNYGENLFDATKVVSEEKEELLPKGFTIDYGNFTKENSFAELGVAIDIAFGEHGYGDRFNQDNPFYIFTVGNSNNKEMLNFLKERSKFNEKKIKLENL